MGNIVFNKPATASNYVSPYAASRAVDGSLQPVQRWLCNTVPCWMKVNLQSEIWINRWIVRHMPVAGWASNYVLSNYKLQGSMDGVNWYDLDIVSSNVLAITDRTFPPINVNYVRLYVNGGLVVNPQMASIMELEVYSAPPTSPYLSNLAVSTGTLTPSFTKTTTNYTVQVGNDVSQITFTPTAEDPDATIIVNDEEVPSGEESEPITLEEGDNEVQVQVMSHIGGLIMNYTVTVTRASNALLSGFVIKSGSRTIGFTPTFDSNTFEYEAQVLKSISAVTITPTAVDTNSTIKVEGTVVPSGGTSGNITVNTGDTVIHIEVTPAVGTTPVNYQVTVHRPS